MNLMALTCEQLVQIFRQRYGRGLFHAAALYRAFYQTAPMDLAAVPAFAASPRLKRQVAADLMHQRPSVLQQHRQQDVTRLVLRLQDGLQVETVIVPMAHHTTVCISSQAGCRMGCGFCRTAQMGLQRHLTAAEIVAQVYVTKIDMGFDVRNVVFMGMGEPLDNYDAVIQAIRVLEDQRGMNIAKRRMTLSTSGHVDGIARLASQNWPQLKLAISLNAPNDQLRNTLMPINRRFPMKTLKSALHRYPLARGNELFIEYVLIRDVNDHPDHARQVAAFLHGLPVKVNLIPYNPCNNLPLRAPEPEAVIRFQKTLIEHHIFVRLRSVKGAGIDAACGQLGARTVRHR